MSQKAEGPDPRRGAASPIKERIDVVTGDVDQRAALLLSAGSGIALSIPVTTPVTLEYLPPARRQTRPERAA